MEVFIHLGLLDLEDELRLWEKDLLGIIAGQVEIELEVLVRGGQQVHEFVRVDHRRISTALGICVNRSDQLPLVIIKRSVGTLIVDIDFDAL